MNKITKLTWKYFWQQKVEEIKEEMISLVVSSIMFGMVLAISGAFLKDNDMNGGFILIGIGSSILIFWIIVSIIFMIKYFINWIISNWKEAKRRAKKDIKNG